MTAATLVPATTWTLDASHSTVGFSAKHMMFTTVKGRFTEIAGTVDLSGETPSAATVSAHITANSIDTGSDQRDQHLRSPDFLDAEQFPAITFRSTRIEGEKRSFRMTGELTIHAISRPITLDVTYEGTGIDPWGGERMGFRAAGKIDRREYGLVWNQALEAGGVLVGNEVKIEIDVQLVKGS